MPVKLYHPELHTPKQMRSPLLQNMLYLSNIKECIERIEEYTCDGKEAFLQTVMIQDAVIRNFTRLDRGYILWRYSI